MGAEIRKIELIANIASGSVGPQAPDTAAAVLAEFGAQARIQASDGSDIEACLQRAVAASPDLVIVLAGDGTARTAVELCGMEGPMVAPLPGGTMNMLPHALYGRVSWEEALRATLATSAPRVIGGGEVEGRTFLVAAILGAPALWAPAREAARRGRFREAWLRGRIAWRRAFAGRLRYALDSGARGKAEAVSFLCPLTSNAMEDEAQALEAAVLTPSGAAEAFRLAVNAAMGDWRRDPSVESVPCRRARVWASVGMPALLDGEPVRLGSTVQVAWRPKVARILAPLPAAEAPAEARP